MKVLVVQRNPTIGAIAKNTSMVLSEIEYARLQGVELCVFPELFLCGYPPDDLLLRSDCIEACHRALEDIIAHSRGMGVIVGCPRRSTLCSNKQLCNSAAVIFDGHLLGYQDKTLLPTYDVFDESRYFSPGNQYSVWDMCGKRIVITICEDIWLYTDLQKTKQYAVDPVSHYLDKEIDLHVNISASPYSVGKIVRRRDVAVSCSERLRCPLILCNQVGGQDGIIFDGSSCIVAADGKHIAELSHFVEESRIVDPWHITGSISALDDDVIYNFDALVLGIRDYFYKQGFTKACLGISGGIDSAVVASLATVALGKEQVLGCFLPSRYTSKESYEDMLSLVQHLGIECIELPIDSILDSYLEVLTPLNAGSGVIEENLQARIRGMLLMALSNRDGSLLLNTSNKSELAVGFSTLYGDTCGAISVLGDMLKRQVYELARYIQKQFGWIPQRIIEKAPTAELRPNQRDSDTIPEYTLLDPIIDLYVVQEKNIDEVAERLSVPVQVVRDIAHTIRISEYKRRQCPFALRVSDRCFSAGRRVPIVQAFNPT